MQESKYAEDITSAIKQDLAARGFVNEHDRLGHFESVVPLDTLFAIARPQNHVKIFALQFKAPHQRASRLRWRLTHPEAQFLKLADGWHRLIWYCLPHYLTTLESSEPLRHTLFVTPKDMAANERAILRGTEPLPTRWMERLRAFLLFYDHPDCDRICSRSDGMHWKQVAPAIRGVAEARIRCNEYEQVAGNINSTEWKAGTALLAGIRKLSRQFGCEESFAAMNLPYPERKSAPSHEGPFEYCVRDPELRAALKSLGSELELRFQKTLAELFSFREGIVEGYQIQSAARYQSLCEEILAREDQRAELANATRILYGLGFDPEYLDHYRSSFEAQLSLYRNQWRPFLRRLMEFAEHILPSESIPELAAAGVKMTGSLSVSITSNSGGGALSCESRLMYRNIDYRPIKDIAEFPLAKDISKSKIPWEGVRWDEYFNAVEACQIGSPLGQQIREELRSSLATLFEGDNDALLVWCDFTEKLCYTIEVRRVIAGGGELGRRGQLGTVQDPLTAGVSPETRRWVSEEARRRGVRMSDVVEEAIELLRSR